LLRPELCVVQLDCFGVRQNERLANNPGLSRRVTLGA
jgi:hypothetical protein